ncbi:MAG: rod shape-determining protein MreC [Oscillospiraceae bacterium]|jgi:rod shape-determining protein MreC|nr:rod shape-determining protein MreC [Christensenellales bacterium]HIR68664.1 rod shape-determining protein MreC [Candidatus Pelethousia gallinarum]
MRDLFKNKLFIFLVIALVILGGLAAFTAGNRAAVTWVEDAINTVAQPIQRFSVRASNSIIDFFERVFKTSDADRENEQLKVRIAQYEIMENELNNLRQENQRLKELLDYADTVEEYERVTAPVIGRSQGIWFNQFTVGAGRNQGVEEDMAVINGAGLVGRVTSVSANTCKVTAIIDSTSDVSVIVERTRDYGFVRGLLEAGGGDDTMELYFLPMGNDLVPGDVLVTSGADGVFPRGLSVGSVLEVSRSSEDAEDRDALVSPTVDFLRLEEVVILTHGPEEEEEEAE